MRASDADRERAAERLRDAAGDGQLTVDELESRLHAAYAARTRGELEPLVADLQAPGATPVAQPGGCAVRPGSGGARWLVALMSGCDVDVGDDHPSASGPPPLTPAAGARRQPDRKPPCRRRWPPRASPLRVVVPQ